MTATLLRLMDNATPIGPIPANYLFLPDLCKKAHIDYKNMTIDVPLKERSETGEIVYEKQEWREWCVVYDEKLQPARRKTTTGRVKLDHTRMHLALTEHTKFCAILDFLYYRAETNMRELGIPGRLNRKNMLNVILGKEDEILLPDSSKLLMRPKVIELFKMDWRAVVNECAKSGMSQYQVISHEEKPEPEPAKIQQEEFKF